MPTKKRTFHKISAFEQDLLIAVLNEELYGMEILAKINKGRPNKATFGGLYPTLRSLQEKELMEGRWGDETSSSGARRRYYQTSKEGKAALDELDDYRAGLLMASRARSDDADHQHE